MLAALHKTSLHFIGRDGGHKDLIILNATSIPDVSPEFDVNYTLSKKAADLFCNCLNLLTILYLIRMAFYRSLTPNLSLLAFCFLV